MITIYINALVKTIQVIPCDVDQYYYVTKILIIHSSISILPIELFNLNLVELDLSNNIIKVLPREIINLTNLEYLNLTYNDLSKLPKEILSLKKIRVLRLINDNKFIETLGIIINQLKILEDNGFID